jgi:hypothetical protein
MSALKSKRSIAAALACMLLPGCAAAPRERPLPTTRIASGDATLEAARRQLEGRWTLVSLDFAAEDGQRVTVPATGDLTLDSFGNLHIEYRLSDEGQAALRAIRVESPNPKISTDGRAVIDPAARRITYVAEDAAARPFDPQAAARRGNPFALERERYYVLDESGMLTLTTRHDNGRDAATSRWKRTAS